MNEDPLFDLFTIGVRGISAPLFKMHPTNGSFPLVLLTLPTHLYYIQLGVEGLRCNITRKCIGVYRLRNSNKIVQLW